LIFVGDLCSTDDQVPGLLGNGILNFEGFVHWLVLPAEYLCAGSCGCFDQHPIFGFFAVTSAHCLTPPVSLCRSFYYSSGFGNFWL